MCVVSAGFMSGRVVVQVSGVCGAHGAGFIMSSLCPSVDLVWDVSQYRAFVTSIYCPLRLVCICVLATIQSRFVTAQVIVTRI